MELLLAAEIRENLGKEKNIKLRKDGFIPGVLYGGGKNTEHISINAHEMDRLVTKHGYGKLLTLKLQRAPKSFENETVLIKEYQRNPVKGNIIHVDFIRVAMDKPINIKVPVHLVNEEKRLRDGSILETVLHEVEVSCLPSLIPTAVTVDVGQLPMGASIHVRDLAKIDGVHYVTGPEEVIVLASAPTSDEVTENKTAEPQLIGKKDEAK